MSTIPFIEATFLDPKTTLTALERRFAAHLHRLRASGFLSAPDRENEVPDEDDTGLHHLLLLPSRDQRIIRRRAERLVERRIAASGLGHLRREDRERLEVLRGGARLITVPNEHRADELAAELHGDMPWMAPATEVVWRAMRRSVREGWPGLQLEPLLLDGPPGIGKSSWARRLGGLLGAPTTVIEATGENAGFAVVGSQRGWGSAAPGRLIGTVLQSGVANPVLVVDEVEKAGTPRSSQGQAYGLAEALLPLLEPMTARRWSCPYYQVRFDMGWVIWVLTSNDYRKLPGPLLSRCPPLPLRSLTPGELAGFVRREGARRNLSATAIDAILDVLAHPSLRHHRPSLRTVARMLQRAADLEARPRLH